MNHEFGSGVSAFDINNDGWVDIHLSSAFGHRDPVYINELGSFNEKSNDLGLNLLGGSVASLWFDYDNDLLPDLLVLNDYVTLDSGNPTLQLFRQVENNQFQEVTSTIGLDLFSEAYSISTKGGLAAGDFNLDGFLDIIQTNWTDGSITLLINESGSGFVDKTLEMGLPRNLNHCFQPLVWDYDNDGDMDLYINVDGDPNELFLNNNQNFINYTESSQMNADGYEMGLAIADFDNNGVFDIFISNATNIGFPNIFYVGFKDSDEINYQEVASNYGIETSGWGWGTTFIDVNNNGFQDLAVTNGIRNDDQSTFWMNRQGTSFLDVSSEIRFDDELDGVSLISVDIDNDGDLDMIQTVKPDESNVTSVRVLENNCLDCGNYIIVKPRMNNVNRYGIGATVEVQTGGFTRKRLITAGTSFYGQEPAEAHFGIGENEMVDNITVTWPGGSKTSIENISANQVIEITDESTLHTPRFAGISHSEYGTTLTWNHMSSVEIGFEIEIASNENFNDSHTISLPNENRSTLDSESTLELNYYRIRALGEETFSDWSPTTPSVNLTPPDELEITYYDTQKAILKWVDNSSAEKSYILQRSLSPLFESSFAVDLNLNQTGYQDNNLEPGFTYYYRVAAKHGPWQSEYSNIAETSIILNTSENQFLIYPNPVSDILQLPNTVKNIGQLAILDLNGRKFRLRPLFDNKFRVDHLTSGVYVIPSLGIKFIKK